MDKLYLASTNLHNVLCSNSKIGTLRETFFVSQIKSKQNTPYTTQTEVTFLSMKNRLSR
ncbi:hypothetical protein MNB_SM-7-10 [hydrothermal vent metagenome]|uniref:Uncharacterized protein n=1 Tax=hydrothermal vent metagenome TaxID=652676 RepID=A0A1W1BGX8_9ZZZZ